jgi:hypothetical protein
MDGWVVTTTVMLATWEVEAGGSLTEAGQGKNMRSLFEKKIKSKSFGDMVQVVEHLPSKHALSSNVIPTKRKGWIDI